MPEREPPTEPQSQAEPQPEPEPQPQPELQPVPEPAPAKAARAAVLLPEVVRHAVVIHNPSSAELVGRCPDALGAAALELGNAVEVRLELPLGRWELQASLGERVWHLPLPLPAAAQRPERVELTIAPPPPPQAGLAWIAPGPALRGDVLGVGQEDERPARVVDIPGFWLATHETSNAEFVAFLNDAGEVAPNWLDLASRKGHIRRGDDGRFVTERPDLPVITVSFEGAQAYCAWRTRVTGRRHRLPTEAEWEKAARGAASWTYSYGDVYQRAAANQESGELRPIAAFAPNGYGLHDMTGNAFEWVADVYSRDAYANAAAPTEGEYRVLRGGSFVLDGMFLRNSMRMKLRPGVRADDVGFRVAVDPE
ncbi:MAG: SUMF1/EgtB/PvdO family nonheme iron enzyme [Planctomycetes bacterium]|nr:SUMF1/EgtB/PvdO family nonheme iron enzyme [Planctomycetota bacterium]MCB9884090.1 SUMF1/EgtB/PvdO family nonheme iron enzyme [Planctomycetota bacterium]